MTNTATQEWKKMLSHVMFHGQSVSPRGLACSEVIGYQSVIDMRHPIIVSAPRKLSHRFMAGEAWWICSGRNDAESIVKYAKNIGRYSDNGTSFFGAYGPALLEQLRYVIDTLQRDPDTRQAVVNIWRERPPETKDVPCTLSWQFLLRDGKLHCNATMRSSDAWLGWPYDVFNFTMVTWLVALHLGEGVVPGKLTLTAGSQHIYDSNLAGIAQCLNHDMHDCQPLSFVDYKPSQLVSELKFAADEDWNLLSYTSSLHALRRDL
jgi:thymidylate synthase